MQEFTLAQYRRLKALEKKLVYMYTADVDPVMVIVARQRLNKRRVTIERLVDLRL